MKTNTRFSILLSLLLGAISLPLIGCENKLTRENYEKIQNGMSVDQVTAILGPGEKMTVGGASKLASSMLGDINLAQQRQNQSQTKQGLTDLVQGHDQKTQREAEGGAPQAHPSNQSPPGTKPPASANTVRVPPTPAAPAGRPPVRDRWIWKSDRIEITVDFTDDRVTTKNQDGL
jgi:hypothetical protein